MDSTAQTPSDSVADDDISIAEYFAVLRRARWLILGFVAACTLGGAITGLLLPAKYTATVVVAPVSSSSSGEHMGGLSSLVSQFSGLASLAGLSIGQSSQASQTLAVLNSYALTERYIAKNHLLPELYASRWNATSKRWDVSDPDKVPTLWKAARFFHKKISDIKNDVKTGIVTMEITWTNPKEAAKWANGLIRMTNDYLRAKAIAEAQRNIDYLNEQAAKTTQVPVREAISSILESQMDKEMLARGTPEYALKVLDPAQPPEIPSSFKPITWTLIGLLGGLGLSLLLAFFRVAWSRSG